MSGSANSQVPPGYLLKRTANAWSPLREPLFRSLWAAAVISYTGTWMQNVGAGWLMTQLTLSPLMISLVQAAATVPVFLAILPAGALADLVDRRRFLIITQSWMVLASGALGIITLWHHITPWVLLLFTFLLGLGAVMNDPAWQAITPEIVSPEQHAPAVALNSVGFNVARAIGPALGGFVVAAIGSGSAFLLNAVSFFGVIFFLYRWKRPATPNMQNERMTEALRTGLRYGRSTHLVHCVLFRTGAFSLSASSLLALLPVIARPHGATGYGILLGSFGFGALIGGLALPHVRNKLNVDGVIGACIILFAGMIFASGQVHGFILLNAVLFGAGAGWIGILASLNVAAQIMSPPQLRARALSMYILVLQGGMAVGSVIWGTFASTVGVSETMIISAVALLAGLFMVRNYGFSSIELAFAPPALPD
jgi:MFS family permease